MSPFVFCFFLNNTAHGTSQYSWADHTTQHTQSSVNIELSRFSYFIISLIVVVAAHNLIRLQRSKTIYDYMFVLFCLFFVCFFLFYVSFDPAWRILANNSIKTIPRFAFSRYTVLEIMSVYKKWNENHKNWHHFLFRPPPLRYVYSLCHYIIITLE